MPATQMVTLKPVRHRELTQFAPVTDVTVEDVISGLSSSSCCLGELPTRFLKSVLGFITTSYTSIQTGVFPKALKTAVIRPRLKKSGVDATVMCIIGLYQMCHF